MKSLVEATTNATRLERQQQKTTDGQLFQEWPDCHLITFTDLLFFIKCRGVDKFIRVGGAWMEGSRVQRARNFWSVCARSERDFFFSVKARYFLT